MDQSGMKLQLSSPRFSPRSQTKLCLPGRQGTLLTLSLITLTQSFLSTSPFAYLTPPLSTLPTSPLSFIRDWIAVIRMHMQYTTEQTAASRHRNIQDAQKRRLYRRAHGLEDVDKEGVGQGIDVRGLVEWDDGLTRGGISFVCL